MHQLDRNAASQDSVSNGTASPQSASPSPQPLPDPRKGQGEWGWLRAQDRCINGNRADAWWEGQRTSLV